MIFVYVRLNFRNFLTSSARSENRACCIRSMVNYISCFCQVINPQSETRKSAPVAISSLQVPGNIHQNNPLIAFEEQPALQDLGALVMQEVMIPMALDHLRQQNGDLPTRVPLFHFEDIVQDWRQHVTIWGIDDYQFRRRESGGAGGRGGKAVPVPAEGILGFVAGRDVQHLHFARDSVGKAEGLLRDEAPTRDGCNDDWLLEILEVGGGLRGKLGVDMAIVVVHPDH